MAENYGKKFEEQVRSDLKKLSDVSVIRLPDPTSGYLGVRNISDFIVYRYPNMIFLECKSVHGSLFPLSNITPNQYNGMLEQSKIPGTICGVMVWWIDKDVTKFFPIQYIKSMKESGAKSLHTDNIGYEVPGSKKRVFFEYYMEAFLNELQDR